MTKKLKLKLKKQTLVRMLRYASMHKTPVLLLNVSYQDYLQTFIRKAETAAELHKYTANTVAIHFTSFSQMCKTIIAKNSNFKSLCLIYNYPSPVILL